MVSILDNAIKLTLIASLYPEKKITELNEILGFTGADLNLSFWKARDMQWLTFDKKADSFKMGETHPSFVGDFDDGVEGIKTRLYAFLFERSKEGDDVDEEHLSQLFTGFSPRDFLIALHSSLEGGMIGKYHIHADGSEYTFYTVADKLDEHRAAKYFKDQSKIKIVTE